MTVADFTTAHGDVRVRVEGLSRTMRAFTRAGADAQDMRDLMHALGMTVVRSANPPHLTGNLADTLRAGRGKTKAVVRAGGARAPYAGVVHYGWPARGIRPQHFLLDALTRERATVLHQLEAGIDELLRKNNLT